MTCGQYIGGTIGLETDSNIQGSEDGFVLFIR